MRESKGNLRETIAASARATAAITLPAVVLIDTGTSGAAELFASALAGNQRADLIGEHTIGRAAIQRLVKLPDGTRPLALDGALSDTRRRCRSTKKGWSRPCRSTTRTSSSASRRRPAIPILDKALEQLWRQEGRVAYRGCGVAQLPSHPTTRFIQTRLLYCPFV